MNVGSTATPGMNVSQLFNSGIDSISKRGEELQAKMNTMMNQGELKTEDMLALQFQMGQYNAMMESLSTITKSMTDLLKNLAQRAN